LETKVLKREAEDWTSEIRSAIAELDDSDPLIREGVLTARQNLADHGVLPYAAAKHRILTRSTAVQPKGTMTSSECRFCFVPARFSRRLVLTQGRLN